MERPARRIFVAEAARSRFATADGVLGVLLSRQILISVYRKSDRKRQHKKSRLLERGDRRAFQVQDNLVDEVGADHQESVKCHLRVPVEEHRASVGTMLLNRHPQMAFYGL